MLTIYYRVFPGGIVAGTDDPDFLPQYFFTKESLDAFKKWYEDILLLAGLHTGQVSWVETKGI